MRKVVSGKEKEISVPLSLKDLEMAVYGLKIWRQVIVAQTFAELREGNQNAYQETIVDIDLAIEKFERAKESF